MFQACNFIKNETLAQVFSCEFCQISKSTFFHEHLRWLLLNPPCSMNASTNVGRCFLNLINKHFAPHHKFFKIFKKNNMKVSYRCCQTRNQEPPYYYKTSTNPQLPTQARACNRINKSSCPLNNKCLSNNLLYKSNVTSTIENYGNKVYYGIVRLSSGHISQTRKYKTDTELFNRIWKLKKKTKIFIYRGKC